MIRFIVGSGISGLNARRGMEFKYGQMEASTRASGLETKRTGSEGS